MINLIEKEKAWPSLDTLGYLANALGLKDETALFGISGKMTLKQAMDRISQAYEELK